MRLTLKQARLIKEKTQEEMAGVLGISVDTYRKIERTPDVATVRQAKKVSDTLGISYNDIFFGSNSSLTRQDDEAS